ncbi:MAG: S8 family serine peptidase [Phenylobacterium sp.]|uniref:S8 family serine peptidase n=1 Tax=Phenylobacterium sp. TaxID=1871053 RepID=UPI001A4766FC|nr:S8 family serine peptidase [Phenylobacterium sp.]MBL8553115.1 S8 family serine peptidase [Phenylobacterium sp.]
MPAIDNTFQSYAVRPGTVLITLESGADIAALKTALGGLAVVAGPGNGAAASAFLRLTVSAGTQIEDAIQQISQIPGVKTAQPDYVLNTFDDGDDGGGGEGGGEGGGDDGGGDPGGGGDADPILGGDPVPFGGGLDKGGGDDPVVLDPPTLEVTAQDVSNDPVYTGGQSWGMYGDTTAKANVNGSQAGEAWTAGYTGSSKVAVGLVDSGLDYTHPDLYLNVWLNPGEIPVALRALLVDTDSDGHIGFRDLNAAANAGQVSDLNANGRIDAGDLLADSRWENGLDEDGNGYTDDLIGWDFINNDNDPFDDVGHGTHVGGIIAAQGGNGVGVAGVTWSTQLIVAKFLGPDGGYTSDAIRALDYVTALSAAPGASSIVATNNSWGGGGVSPLLGDAIGRGAQADVLFIAAAGNGGDDQVGDNNNVVPNYPSNYDTVAMAGYDAVIAVASITSAGALSSFSNYGAATVDLGAPGTNINSTIPGGYGAKSGTSMATPFVTGAVAMYAALNPGASAAQIRADLLAATTPTASLAGKTVTGGRLDVSALIYDISPAGVSVTGTASADTISLTAAPAGLSKSSVFDDTLSGGAGNDKLDGGPGVDRLVGGQGNDTYTADASDTIVEGSNEGVDLVNSAGSYVLGANLEKLTLTGAAAVNGTGNELDNTLTGNSAGNVLDGLAGADTLVGGAGADTLIGGQGNDKLTGGTEADFMAGGQGDDTYDVDSAGDVVVEAANEGNDLVTSAITYTLGANLERLTLSGTAAINGTGNTLANTLAGNTAGNVLTGDLGDDTLNGNEGADTLLGGEGNDRLNGGTGADSMDGGLGDDAYYVDDAGDVASEGAGGGGNDIVTSTSATYTLGANIERLTLTGTTNINGTGNGLDNAITGNTGANVIDGGDGADTISANAGNDTLLGGAGNDKLTGGAGADRMEGGGGDDTYYVDDVGDVAVEGPNAGTDLVSSSVSFTLGDNIEKLTLTGTAAANGSGNTLGNTLTGNAAANRLSGLDGGDTLSGGAGTDTLDGGAGVDKLTGGADLDRFVFQKGQAAGDTITDFAAGEKLELHGWGAGSTIAKVTGSLTNWIITDGVTGATETITLSNKYNLVAGDWIFS